MYSTTRPLMLVLVRIARFPLAAAIETGCSTIRHADSQSMIKHSAPVALLSGTSRLFRACTRSTQFQILVYDCSLLLFLAEKWCHRDQQRTRIGRRAVRDPISVRINKAAHSQRLRSESASQLMDTFCSEVNLRRHAPANPSKSLSAQGRFGRAV